MGDVDRSLDILIRTRAELKGAQELEAALERDIGKAKALGVAYDAQAAKLAKVRDSIAASTAANKELGDAQGEAGKAGETALRKVGEETSHAHGWHKRLHAAVKGLREEFPGLAHIAHFALNPITLLVAGISSAWALWHERVKSLTEALAGVELPDSQAMEPGHVNALATEWENYAKAIEKTVTAYSSVSAASDRQIEKIKKELEEQKKLLAARRGEELANLESDKSRLTPAEYETAKAHIEQRYADAGLRLEQGGEQAILAERTRRAGALSGSAAAKRAEAAGIRVASATDDETTKKELEKRKVAAEESIKEREKRIADLTDFDAHQGEFTNIAQRTIFAAKVISKYGADATSDDAIAMEKEGLGYDKTNISRYDAFMRQKDSRERARTRRSDLLSQAAAEEGEAIILRQSLPEDRRAQAAHEQNDQTVRNAETASRILGTPAGQAAKQAIAESYLTTRDIEQHKTVSQEDRDKLVDVASGIAGHHLSLSDSEKQMHLAMQNQDKYNATLMRLTDAIEHIATTASNGNASLEQRVSTLEALARNLESRQNASRAR